MKPYLFVVCAVTALAGIAKGEPLQVILCGVPALFMLMDLYPPTGGKK